jgi:hypothetical protein
MGALHSLDDEAAALQRFDFARSAPFDNRPAEREQPKTTQAAPRATAAETRARKSGTALAPVQATGALPSKSAAAQPSPLSKPAVLDGMPDKVPAGNAQKAPSQPASSGSKESQTFTAGTPEESKPSSQPVPSRQASITEEVPETPSHAAAPAPSPEAKPAARARSATASSRRVQRRVSAGTQAPPPKAWRPSNLENWPAN